MINIYIHIIRTYVRTYDDNLAPRTKRAASPIQNSVCVFKIGRVYSRICKMFDLICDKINQLFRGHLKFFLSINYKINDCSE